MFDRSDFTVFADPTLVGRLAAIRQRVDPKFERVGQRLAIALAQAGVPAQTLHVAKHQRRHKNPPPDTWVALAANRRGYKMVPHLELGLWPDRLFLWLAVLREAKPTTAIDWASLRAQALALPEGFALSGDHTSPAAVPLTAANWTQVQMRYTATQRGELLIGRTFAAQSAWFDRPAALDAELDRTVLALAPLYRTLL
ncbi:DUF1054 family protein [Lacticaseibacillus daqingensis]|uniref:DUF1054 family protein n=1 Tax=Lacticaseibacillus daqingensis TaxID=2486014 RepID=UPI000F7A6B8B|nr:DUF1054 family protein [Lacticaseibacillus daqingensis]